MRLFYSIWWVIAVFTVSRAFADFSDSPAVLETPNSKTAPSSTDSVMARGKGFEIRRSQMDQVLAAARTNRPEDALPPDAEIHVLNQLIEIQLILQKATDREKAEAKKKSEANFASIINYMGKAEFERRLKTTHTTGDDLRLMLFEEEAAQTSLTHQLGIEITDAEAKKYFDESPEAFDEPEKVHIRELLLLTTVGYSSDSLPEAVIQAKRRQIQELHKRVLAGEDFATLARQYNEDPLSKNTGGEFSFTSDQMEKEIKDQAFFMKPGQISEVLNNDDGYLFFQLIELIPAKKAEFTVLADRLKSTLTAQKKQMLAPIYLQKLRKEADIQIVDPGLKTKIAAAEVEAEEAARARASLEAKQASEATNLTPGSPR